MEYQLDYTPNWTTLLSRIRFYLSICKDTLWSFHLHLFCDVSMPPYISYWSFKCEPNFVWLTTKPYFETFPMSYARKTKRQYKSSILFVKNKENSTRPSFVFLTKIAFFGVRGESIKMEKLHAKIGHHTVLCTWN